MAARLEVIDLTRRFPGGATALDGVGLDVPAGGRLAIIGASGAGKTTLIRVVLGLEAADSGQVRLDGVAIDHLPPHRRGMAAMFQSPALYPHLDVARNLRFGLREQGLKRSEAVARAEDVAALLGLSPLMKRRPAALSGGERQRVALGRALARRPRVLLLDEPFAHLDRPLRLDLRDELDAHLTRLGLTAVIVTHDPEDALALGDRVVVLAHGRVVRCDTPEGLLAGPGSEHVARFVAGLGGGPLRGGGDGRTLNAGPTDRT
jgi:multiple sugar transport system ATP-binding protein